jgi:hypothetical protein
MAQITLTIQVPDELVNEARAKLEALDNELRAVITAADTVGGDTSQHGGSLTEKLLTVIMKGQDVIARRGEQDQNAKRLREYLQYVANDAVARRLKTRLNELTAQKMRIEQMLLQAGNKTATSSVTRPLQELLMTVMPHAALDNLRVQTEKAVSEAFETALEQGQGVAR